MGDFRNGDILLVKGYKDKKMSRILISFFESLLALKNKISPKKVWVHSANIVDHFGRLYVYEMKIHGCRRVLLKYWLKKNPNYCSLRFHRDLSSDELERWELANTSAWLNHIKYYFSGLISFAIYRLTGNWYGKELSNDNKELICSEHTTKCFNKAVPNTFKDTYKQSPTSIYINPYFNIIKNGNN